MANSKITGLPIATTIASPASAYFPVANGLVTEKMSWSFLKARVSGGLYNDAIISARITSVNSRVTNLSATLENRISAVSAVATGGGYNDAAISARITSVNSRVATVSGKHTSIRIITSARITSVNSRIATVSGLTTTNNARSTSIASRLATVSARITSAVQLSIVVNNTATVSCSGNYKGNYAHRVIYCSNAAATAFRLRAQNWVKGQTITIIQGGAGQVSIGTKQGGTTIRARGGLVKITGQYGQAGVVFLGASVFAVTGDLS